MMQRFSQASSADIAWINAQVGARWCRESFNCWDFFADAQRALFDREVPRFRIGHPLPAGVRGSRLSWRKTDAPKHGDLVEMAHGRRRHVGLWLDVDGGRVAHCAPMVGVVCDRPEMLIHSGWRVRDFWTPAQDRASDISAPVVRVASMAAAFDLSDASRDQYARGVEVIPGETLSDLARREGLSHSVVVFQPPDIIPEHDAGDADAAAAAFGFVPRGDWCRTLLDRPTLIVDLPQGGEGSNPLRTILMVAVMIAATVVSGGLLAPVLGGAFAAGTVGASLAAAAIGIGGSALINAVLPPPSPPGLSGPGQASPTYSIGAQGNMARLSQMVPVQFGRHLHFPDYATQPWAAFSEDGSQYLQQLFVLGVGNYDLEQVKVGDTVIWANGALTNAVDDISFALYRPGELVSYEHARNIFTSRDVSQIVLDHDPDGLSPFYATTSAGQIANEVHLDVVAPRGIYVVNDDGDLVARSVDFSVLLEDRDEDGQVVYATQTSFSISGENGSADAIRRSIPIALSPGNWFVRLVRDTTHNDDPSSGDEVVWVGLRGNLSEWNADFGDLSLLALSFKANEYLSGSSSRRVSVLKTRALAQGVTRSIAAAVSELCEFHGVDYSTEELAQLDVKWRSLGWVFDAVLDQRQSFWGLLEAILRIGAARPVQIGSKIHFRMDEPQSLISQVFGPRNILRDSLTEAPRLPSPALSGELIAEYWSSKTWASAEVVVGAARGYGEPTRVRYQGVTIERHAQTLAEMDVAAALYRPISVSFEAGFEGRLIAPGDLIAITHPDLDSGDQVDVVGLDGSVLQLAESVGDGQYDLVLTDPKGGAWGPVSAQIEGANAAIADADWDEAVAAFGSDPAEWLDFEKLDLPRLSFGRSGHWARLAIVTGIGAASEGRLRVSAELYDDRVYDPLRAAYAEDGSDPESGGAGWDYNWDQVSRVFAGVFS